MAKYDHLWQMAGILRAKTVNNAKRVLDDRSGELVTYDNVLQGIGDKRRLRPQKLSMQSSTFFLKINGIHIKYKLRDVGSPETFPPIVGQGV
jgi:hypothetical protein